jgi:dihydropteroate synthase type 2
VWAEAAPEIVGIVNCSEDSFSDGGLYLQPEPALEHARRLHADGARYVELGPASSHPDARAVSASEEIRRLEPLVEVLAGAGIPVGVDSFQLETQRWCLERGVELLNDIDGFAEPGLWPELARSSCRLVVMHSIQERGRATRAPGDPDSVRERVELFFEERLAGLEAAGVARERLILDPGMGFFLGVKPASSLVVLRGLRRLRERFGLPLLVSVSRKSFLGGLLADPSSGEPRAVAERGAGTLAAELWLAQCGVEWIRTHDVRALRDALCVLRVLEASP